MDDVDPIRAVGLVAVGGFLGSISRYGVSTVLPGLPGTLVVNVTGSFALGCLLYWALATGSLPGRARLVAATGFLSSFTTYSTFAVDAALAPRPLGVAYVLGSYALGFAGVLAARPLADAVATRRGYGAIPEGGDRG